MNVQHFGNVPETFTVRQRLCLKVYLLNKYVSLWQSVPMNVCGTDVCMWNVEWQFGFRSAVSHPIYLRTARSFRHHPWTPLLINHKQLNAVWMNKEGFIRSAHISTDIACLACFHLSCVTFSCLFAVRLYEYWWQHIPHGTLLGYGLLNVAH